jgi:Domain of unknown function (DUF4234)
MADDEDLPNPYAAPRTAFGDPTDPSDEYDGTSEYEGERRPVVLCILLTIVTLGFYPAIWLLKRSAFLDRLNASQSLGTALPTVVIVMNTLGFAAAFAGKEASAISSFLSLGAGVCALVANFRVAAILRSDFARTGRFLSVSSVLTFFLSIYYLQYKINEAAETPARVKRKKKRKKKPTDVAAEADDVDTDSPAT